MILFIASVSHTDKNTVGAYMMLPVFGASFVIITAQSKYTSIVNRWLSIKPLQFIGNLSYSLYLWHWPIFIFIGVKITDTNIFVSFAGFAVSLVLAFVTYHFVENPIRYNRFLSQNLFASIGLGILLTVLVSGISLFIFTVNKKMIAQSRHQIYFDSLKQSSKLYAENCHAKFFDIKSKKCVFGDLTSNTTVVLFGDSHAANWFPALELIALREGWRLVPLTKTSCPAVSYEPFHKKRYRAYTECTQWREWAFQRISELNPYLTIISSTNSYLFSTPRNEEKQKPRIWQESMNTTLKRLEKISDFTVLIHDTPRLPFSAPKCLSRALWQGTTPEATCVFDVRPSKHDPFYNAEMVAITGIERTFLIDMNDIICPTSPCRVYQDGMILFSDKHHLTVNFSRSLSAQLMARLHLFLPSTPKKGQ